MSLWRVTVRTRGEKELDVVVEAEGQKEAMKAAEDQDLWIFVEDYDREDSLLSIDIVRAEEFDGELEQ